MTMITNQTIIKIIGISCFITFLTACSKKDSNIQVDTNKLMPIEQIESTIVNMATIVYYTQGSNYNSAVKTCADNQDGSRKACIQYVYKFIADNKGLAEKIAEENKANMQFAAQNDKLISDNKNIAESYNLLNRNYLRIHNNYMFNKTFLFINIILSAFNLFIFIRWLKRSGWLNQLRSLFRGIKK